MTEEDASSLASYLKQARLQAGLSLRELAAQSGVSFAHIRRVEEGTNKPTVEVLQKLGQALKLDLDELFSTLGINRSRALPEPRVYFRRKYGVSEEDAEVMARLIEKYRNEGGLENGENIEE